MSNPVTPSNTASNSNSNNNNTSAAFNTESSSPEARFVSNLHCFVPDTSIPCSLVLLNTAGSFASLDRIWRATDYHIVADGAANHLYRTIVLHSLWTENQEKQKIQQEQELLPKNENSSSSSSFPNNIFSFISSHPSSLPSPSTLSPVTLSLLQQYIPDCICGDWDSIDKEIEIFYASLGVHIIKDSDQYSNDLVKCLVQVHQRNQSLQISPKVIVYGAFGGRFDQEMNNMNSLYTFSAKFQQLTLLSDDCLAILIPTGITDIQIAYPYEGPLCGLIPLGKPVQSLTTKGLHWDVTNWRTEFTGIISTSNHIDGYPYSHPLITGTPATTDEENGTASSFVSLSSSSNGIQLPMMVRIETSEPIIWTASVKKW